MFKFKRQCKGRTYKMAAVITSGLLQTLGTLVMTAQTTTFSYELACKGFSVEKPQHLVT